MVNRCSYLLAVVSVMTYVFNVDAASSNYLCNRDAHESCARLAGPLLRDPNLVFPDNLDDIQLVCRTWDGFVDCLKTYVERCFSEGQRREFNKAVQSPVQSVHRMCADPQYQDDDVADYLRYAPCIKSTVTDDRYCGRVYRQLAEQVAPRSRQNGNDLARATLCCSYDAFERCVKHEARILCDGGRDQGPASLFVEQVLGKALGFLGEQCANYIPNSGDCSLTTDSISMSSDSESAQTNAQAVSYNTYGRSTGWDQPNRAPYSPSTPMEPSPSYGTPTWMPHSATQTSPRSEVYITPSTTPDYSSMRSTPDRSDATFSHRSARPLGYGRSVAWTPSSMSSTSGPTVPDWATATTRKTWQNEVSATQPWYPQSGGYYGNKIDEPNQQGLSNPQYDNADNASPERFYSKDIIVLISCLFAGVMFLHF